MGSGDLYLFLSLDSVVMLPVWSMEFRDLLSVAKQTLFHVFMLLDSSGL